MINAKACMIHISLFALATKAVTFYDIPAGDAKEPSLKAHHSQNSAKGDCNQDKCTDNRPYDHCLLGGSITVVSWRRKL